MLLLASYIICYEDNWLFTGAFDYTWHFSVYFDDIWLFVSVSGWYLTLYFCLYLTLYKCILMTPDSLSVYTWCFITTSADMWLCQYILMTFDSVSVSGWYLTLYFCLYLTLYKCILMTPGSLSVYTWRFITTSADMWLFASIFWWHLTFHQCIQMILNSLSVSFDDTWVCQCTLMALDSFYQHIW
jgi:hypothetical protein